MTEREWAEKIGINRECFETIEKNRISDSDKLVRMFWDDEPLFYDIMKSGVFSHGEILSFFFYHCFEYRKSTDDPDIATGVFDEGMQDIMIWAEDCFGHHGYYGISEERYGWIAKLLKKEVIRLGRLEFEPSVMKESVKIRDREIAQNSKIIN
ncbi:MAG: hypothetical protein KBT47_02310, partial [Armatimonadetes bacterium]|nr:hypothetical protein [Candidatus Hippobium faecium]